MRDRALWLLILTFPPLVLGTVVVVVLIGSETFVVSPERRVAPEISLAVVPARRPGAGMLAAAIELAAPVGRASRGVAFGGRRAPLGTPLVRVAVPQVTGRRAGAGGGVAVCGLRTARKREGLVSEIER
jgi:hypothetical protein